MTSESAVPAGFVPYSELVRSSIESARSANAMMRTKSISRRTEITMHIFSSATIQS